MLQLTLAALMLGQTPSITVTAPTASSDVVVGTTFTITWTTEVVNDVKIALTTDDGGSWTTITDSVDTSDTTQWQSYPWTVPNDPSVTCRIRISDYNAPATFDDSETFEIRQPALGDNSDDEGGCAAASGSAAGALLVLLAFRRRRR